MSVVLSTNQANKRINLLFTFHHKAVATPVRSTVAVYSYDSGEEGQLMFREGEIICVEEDGELDLG